MTPPPVAVRISRDGRKLTLIRRAHPGVTVLVWGFAAAAAALCAWVAGAGLQVDCARSRGTCFVRVPQGEQVVLPLPQLRKAEVRPDGGRVALFADGARLGSTPLVREADLRETADRMNAYLAGSAESLFWTVRNWPLAVESAFPFAVVAVGLAVFRRRRFRLTLQRGEGTVAAHRQTLLTSAHAHVLPSSAAVTLDATDAPTPKSRRLVVLLPSGESFVVTPWEEDKARLEPVRQQVEAFLGVRR